MCDEKFADLGIITNLQLQDLIKTAQLDLLSIGDALQFMNNNGPINGTSVTISNTALATKPADIDPANQASEQFFQNLPIQNLA